MSEDADPEGGAGGGGRGGGVGLWVPPMSTDYAGTCHSPPWWLALNSQALSTTPPVS